MAGVGWRRQDGQVIFGEARLPPRSAEPSLHVAASSSRVCHRMRKSSPASAQATACRSSARDSCSRDPRSQPLVRRPWGSGRAFGPQPGVIPSRSVYPTGSTPAAPGPRHGASFARSPGVRRRLPEDPIDPFGWRRRCRGCRTPTRSYCEPPSAVPGARGGWVIGRQAGIARCHFTDAPAGIPRARLSAEEPCTIGSS